MSPGRRAREEAALRPRLLLGLAHVADFLELTLEDGAADPAWLRSGG